VLLSCDKWHYMQPFDRKKLKLSKTNLDHPAIERETESLACVESRRKILRKKSYREGAVRNPYCWLIMLPYSTGEDRELAEEASVQCE